MAQIKTIRFENTTGSNIELDAIGDVVHLAAGSPLGTLDVSNYTAAQLRLVTDLDTKISSGDIIVNDGSQDLIPEVGLSYTFNDIINDEDGFWYAKRRRLSTLVNKSSHGFVVGESISIELTGSPPASTAVSVNSLLDGSSIDTFAMVSEVVDVDNFYAAFSGEVEGVDPSVVEGSPTTLVTGRTYFLSATDGKMTKTAPTEVGLARKSVGLAVTEDTLVMTTTPASVSPLISPTDTSPQVGVQQANTSAVFATLSTWKFPVLSRTVTDPSTLTPVANDRYIVAPGAIGVWAGLDNEVVTYSPTLLTWFEDTPINDWITFVADEGVNVRYTAGSPPVGWEVYPAIEQLANVNITAEGNNNTLKFTTAGSPPQLEWINVSGLAAPPEGSFGVIQLFWGPIDGISGTTKIPKDTTIPLITEGTEIWSQDITPTGGSPATTIRARTNFTFSSSNSALELVIAVFRDSTCIGVGVSSTSNNNSGFSVSMAFYDPGASLSTHTYSCRVGRSGNNGTWYVNEISGTPGAFPLPGSPNIGATLVEQNAFLLEEIGVHS